MDFLEHGSIFSLFDVATGGPVRALTTANTLIEVLREEAEESPDHIAFPRVVSCDADGNKVDSVSAEELLTLV